jgi:hypothetical protein
MNIPDNKLQICTAMDNIIAIVTANPCLGLHRIDVNSFIIRTDASVFGIGTPLWQIQPSTTLGQQDMLMLSIFHQNALWLISHKLLIEWLALSIYHLEYIGFWLRCGLRDHLVLSENILLSLSTIINPVKVIACLFRIPKSVKHLYSIDLSYMLNGFYQTILPC